MQLEHCKASLMHSFNEIREVSKYLYITKVGIVCSKKWHYSFLFSEIQLSGSWLRVFNGGVLLFPANGLLLKYFTRPLNICKMNYGLQISRKCQSMP